MTHIHSDDSSVESVMSPDESEKGFNYAADYKRRGTGVPLVSLPEEPEEDPQDQKPEVETGSHSTKQEWGQVDMVAWILLLCITIECFIEGNVNRK